jgi:hypothetical protein
MPANVCCSSVELRGRGTTNDWGHQQERRAPQPLKLPTFRNRDERLHRTAASLYARLNSDIGV